MAPFGGVKDSGIGREEGTHAINEYAEIETAWIDTGNTIKDPFNPRAQDRAARTRMKPITC